MFKKLVKTIKSCVRHQLMNERGHLTDFRISDLLLDCSTLICSDGKQKSGKCGGNFNSTRQAESTVTA